MTPRGGPPSQLPTLTEVVVDATPVAGGAEPDVGTADERARGPAAAALAPPARVSLTRKPRAPLPLAPAPASASSQLPLLGMPAQLAQSRRGTGAAAPSAGGLGADIFGDAADVAPVEGDDQLVRAVLADLQRHVDQMLEYRLRASLTPLLTQMADNLVRELRQELASTLRDVVKRAVGQEVARRRKR